MNGKRGMIEGLRETRKQTRTEARGLVERAQNEGRDLTRAEQAMFDRHMTDLGQIEDRIEELTEQADRDDAAAVTARRFLAGPVAETRSTPGLPAGPAASASGWSVGREPEVYRRDGRSFFADLYAVRAHGDRDAAERLHRNDQAATARRAARGEVRAISTSNGAGGEFVPPLWIEEEWIALARPGRITADLCVGNPLPAGTDVINLPKVNTGSAVAQQTAQNTAISQQDVTTTAVSSPVVTIAGGQTVSMQLIEQSPINVDQVIIADLSADYAMKLDQQVINGTGTGGAVTGLLNLTGTQTVTWTNASPTLGGANGLYSKVATCVAQIHATRYAPPDAIIMHPRRWAWCTAQSDSSNRPLIVPESHGPFNALAVQTTTNAQGPVGTLLGYPVYTDPNMPVNLGAGTNQDAILLVRRSDLYLWESNLRAEAFQQTYAQNLSLFIRLYAYMAFIGNRYQQGVGVITGTGLVTPVFP